MFIAHIGAMDAFALGLKKAAFVLGGDAIADKKGILPTMVANRYASFDSGFGARVEKGEASLEDACAYIEQHGLPTKLESGQQEAYEMIFNRLLH